VCESAFLEQEPHYAQQGAPYGPTRLAKEQARFQLLNALGTDFLSYLPRALLSEPLLGLLGKL
jgi:hypothetical protein